MTSRAGGAGAFLLVGLAAVAWAAADVPPAPGTPSAETPAARIVPASLRLADTGGEAAIDAELVARGRFLYGLHCADCHGAQGRGDGPRAVHLDIPPSDLTGMSRRAGGAFPFLAAYGVIDGRYGPESHRADDMPAWGLVFQELDKDTDQTDEVRGRILQLLHYLRSIQEDVENVEESGQEDGGR